MPVDRLFAPTILEFLMTGDVGGIAELVVMACDQDKVLGRNQVRLDIIGPLIDRALIGCQRMFGPFTTAPSVRDDQDLVICLSRLSYDCREHNHSA